MTSIAPRIGAVLEMEEEEMMIVAMRTGVGRRAARDIADAGDDGPEHDDPESLMQQLTNPRDLDPLLIWKVKFCRRWERQCPKNFEMEHEMTAESVRGSPLFYLGSHSGGWNCPLVFYLESHYGGWNSPIVFYLETHWSFNGEWSERKVIGSVVGRLNWRDKDLGCDLEEMVIVSMAPCMSAEVSALVTCFEHGDFVRAVFCKLIDYNFDLRRWKLSVARWPHYLVTDARTGYDALNSDTLPTDRKVAIDVAVLRQA
ncbi:unnamed protein product [Symbiodinium microadriaticum]|nr:unnamed protein product [Symbiodinium microadriaticum]